MNPAKTRRAKGYSLHNSVKLIRGGNLYFNLMEELIDTAISSVHLQVYIFDADETGLKIVDALLRAAKRKIPVYMLLDGYGSSYFPDNTIKELVNAGVHFRWFEPIFKGDSFYVGRRMHHKILVVDGVYSLVGGLNISNRYNDMPNEPAWLDWALYTVGEVSTELFTRCVEMWKKNKRMKLHLPLPHWQNALSSGEECMVRVRINDWVRNKNQISNTYGEMFRRVNEDVIILSSYFLPGRIFRKNLIKAVGKGVKVRLILAGHTDIKLAKAAELFLYSWLFRKGIEIYEYKKTVLHGKLAVFDGQWATVGSFNINNLSAYASVELNLDVDDKVFGQHLKTRLEELMSNECIRIDPKQYVMKLGIFSKLKYWVSYELVRLIFFLFTFYFKREKLSDRKK